MYQDKGRVGLKHPDKWLALLRIAVGLWFLRGGFRKVTFFLWGGFLPLPTATDRWIGFMPKRIAEFASGNPIGWYKEFLEGTVLHNAKTFAFLTAWGEFTVGVGLTLGLLTVLAGVIGLVMMGNYFLASAWMGFGPQGFHLLLMVCMTLFIGSRAGRFWGLDGNLIRRRSKLRWLSLLS
ncbi:MAG: TQO small subunit DoxD [Candidatus Methylomirabilales bacterium]